MLRLIPESDHDVFTLGIICNKLDGSTLNCEALKVESLDIYTDELINILRGK